MVPSSGSTTQRRGRWCPPRCHPPRRGSRRPAALGEQLADRPLGVEIGLADEIGGRALAAHAVARRPRRTRSSSSAPASRRPRRQPRAARRPRSRHARSRRASLTRTRAGELRPRALGLDLRGERQQRRLVAGSPDQLHRARQPVGVEAGGTDAAGWPVTFQTPCTAPWRAALSVHSAPRPWSWPMRGGGVAGAGVSSTSWSSIRRSACARLGLARERALEQRARDQAAEPRHRAVRRSSRSGCASAAASSWAPRR